MTLALIVMGLAAVLFGVGAWLILAAHDLPSPTPTASPQPLPTSPVPVVTLRLISERGRDLGVVRIPKRERKVGLQHRMGLFVAERQEHDGTWIYRRVGGERES